MEEILGFLHANYRLLLQAKRKTEHDQLMDPSSEGIKVATQTACLQNDSIRVLSLIVFRVLEVNHQIRQIQKMPHVILNPEKRFPLMAHDWRRVLHTGEFLRQIIPGYMLKL